MEIRPVTVDDRSNLVAAGQTPSKILERAERVASLQWPSNSEFGLPRQRPSSAPTAQIKGERLVLSIKRQDGSEVLSIYA